MVKFLIRKKDDYQFLNIVALGGYSMWTYCRKLFSYASLLALLIGLSPDLAETAHAAKMPALTPPHAELRNGFNPRKIPIEIQAWYMPDFGHLHITTLAPLGQSVGKSGSVLKFDFRMVIHHNPSAIEGVNLPTVPLVSPRPKQMYRFGKDLTCPYDKTCAFNEIINHKVYSPDDANRWMSIRLREESETPEVLNPSTSGEFNTSSELPFYVSDTNPKRGHAFCEKSKKTPQTASCFVGKGWYDFLGYAQARIDNVPLQPVKGNHTFYVGPYKSKSKGEKNLNITVDLDQSHAIPATGKWLAVPHTKGKQIFEKTNALTGDLYPVTVDTTELENGWHSIAVRADRMDTRKTSCKHPACTGAENTLSGVAKIWFYVANGGKGGSESASDGSNSFSDATPLPPQEIYSDDGNLRLDMASTSLSTEVTQLMVTNLRTMPVPLPAGTVPISGLYELTADVNVFDQPAILALHTTDVQYENDGHSPPATIYWWNAASKQWEALVTNVDEEGQEITASITQLGLYTILAPIPQETILNQRLYLPFISR